MSGLIIKKDFIIRIALPALLVFILFFVSIFAFIIPSFKTNMLNGKREMISELTNSALSILDNFNFKYENNLASLDSLQSAAINEIRSLRYGEENKDYFWITDEHPNMIMHPYLPELDGTDLSDYSDPEGKRLFVEFVKVINSNGEGFVDYMWQWKDDSSKIVPKLSYVRHFKPWGWIIGTGIYIEDVKEEIEILTNKLIYISLFILLLAGVILFYIGRQSLNIESERQEAEEGLRESEKKYRALVEASTDGLVLIIDDDIVYVNNALLEMLGYSTDVKKADLRSILSNHEQNNIEGVNYFNQLLDSGGYRSQFDTKLITRSGEQIDVILYTSEISFGKKTGFTVIVKDISTSKRISEELGTNKERFNTLINNVNIGVIRITLGKFGKFIEANSPALKIFGYNQFNELKDIKINDILQNVDEQEQFFEKLLEIGVVENNVLQIKKRDGSSSMVSISAMVVKDNSGNDKYCDAIIEDITDRIKLNEERENLIVELQTSLKFLHQPVDKFLKKIVSCNMNASIKDGAKIITRNKYSSILIQAESGEFIGIVTDHDLRERAIANDINTDQPIFTVMSSPLITVSSNSFVFEALMKMHENSTRHLAVKDNSNAIIGIISSEELLTVDRQSSAYLLREIDICESVEELSWTKEKLPRLIKTLVDSGAKTKNITKIITSIFDAIVNKLVEFGISKYGVPPAEFSFVALGSAGRKEQTLISDQDNAIIFEDVNADEFEQVKQYFDQLAEYICNGLKECGYEFCPGLAMANNTKWTQPLNVWIDYFHNWIANSSQQDLIDISIYFDFRHIYGKSALVEKLRDELKVLTEGQSGFFTHLTKNCLLHKPPVGILGKLVLESRGEGAETFDIKLATMPISDFARIYALKHSLRDTNTLERLQSLFNNGVITKNSYEEILQAYNFLMQLRFRHQAIQITANQPFDNFINPKELTQIEIKTLKNTFSQILGVQKRLGYDFSGEAL